VTACRCSWREALALIKFLSHLHFRARATIALASSWVAAKHHPPSQSICTGRPDDQVRVSPERASEHLP
jgi:hypothetical protein